MENSDIKALTKAIRGLDDSVRSMQEASDKKPPRRVEMKALPDPDSQTTTRVSYDCLEMEILDHCIDRRAGRTLRYKALSDPDSNTTTRVSYDCLEIEILDHCIDRRTRRTLRYRYVELQVDVAHNGKGK